MGKENRGAQAAARLQTNIDRKTYTNTVAARRNARSCSDHCPRTPSNFAAAPPGAPPPPSLADAPAPPYPADAPAPDAAHTASARPRKASRNTGIARSPSAPPASSPAETAAAPAPTPPPAAQIPLLLLPYSCTSPTRNCTKICQLCKQLFYFRTAIPSAPAYPYSDDPPARPACSKVRSDRPHPASFAHSTKYDAGRFAALSALRRSPSLLDGPPSPNEPETVTPRKSGRIFAS